MSYFFNNVFKILSLYESVFNDAYVNADIWKPYYTRNWDLVFKENQNSTLKFRIPCFI